MNMRAYMYEGLIFSEEDFQRPRKSRVWQLILDVTERLGKRYAKSEMDRRERALLGQMGERQLADIGLTVYDVQREINRSFYELGGSHR